MPIQTILGCAQTVGLKIGLNHLIMNKKKHFRQALKLRSTFPYFFFLGFLGAIFDCF